MKVESIEVIVYVFIGKDIDGGFGLFVVFDVYVVGVLYSEV